MKLECKYGFYTCVNTLEKYHFKGICDNCCDGQNYQHKDDFNSIILIKN